VTNLLLSGLALLALTAPAYAQQPARVMVLGTYHFANPGLDIVNTPAADVMTAEKQAEIAAVLDALAAFAPTRVAVEVRAERQSWLDSLYVEYRAGRHELGPNEVFQLGFRLAARLGSERVYAVDHRGDFPFGAVMAHAEAHDPAFVAHFGQLAGRLAAENDSLQRTATVGEILRYLNEPGYVAWGHAEYVRMAAVGAGDGYAGSDLLAAWYARNIRIFADLARLAGPGERVLAIVGAGHAAILRELIESARGMELVEPAEYL